MKATDAGTAIGDAMARARGHSPFLRLQLETFPAIAAALAAGSLDEAMDLAAAKGSQGSAGVAATLRRERSGVALTLAIGDLAGLLPLESVVTRLSDLADSALERALTAATTERTPHDDPRG